MAAFSQRLIIKSSSHKNITLKQEHGKQTRKERENNRALTTQQIRTKVHWLWHHQRGSHFAHCWQLRKGEDNGEEGAKETQQKIPSTCWFII